MQFTVNMILRRYNFDKDEKMRSKNNETMKHKLIPYVLFPSLIGAFTGVVIFLFKIATTAVIRLSERIYSFVRENPVYLPLLIIAMALIGLCAALLLKYAKECRGGGIPSAVAGIRGLIPMKWVQGLLGIFASSLLTFIAGVPLGNEGPSVQMGAAVGKGNSDVFNKKKKALERYLMTGGACSGFAIATGAPLTGILFALEEAHRRFSATLFAVASVAVLSGTVTHRYLAFFFKVDTTFFDLTISQLLPMRYLWVAIIIGAVCGVCSLLFAKLYQIAKGFSKVTAKKLGFISKIVIIFALTALLGFLSESFIGTGHHLIGEILDGKIVWYIVLIAFVARAVVMIVSNIEGVSGGIFVPNLAFGAMIASLITDAIVAIGLVDGSYYTILIVVGMASFLAASSRTPVTAIAFAAEALCIASNIIPVVFGVVVSYLIAELSGKMSYTDTVIESRTEAAHQAKDPVIINSHLTVNAGAFADGMEIRDILWPPTCVVLSVDRNLSHAEHRTTSEIREGDVLHLHYQTYDPDETMRMLVDILGDQPENRRIRAHLGSDEHVVPLD
jgi:H+/Cl- antiporter ClcA